MKLLRRSLVFRAVALFGLFFQLSVSLGHHHNEILSKFAHSTLQNHNAQLPSGEIINPFSPTNAPLNNNSDQDCQICWSTAMAGSAALAAPNLAVVPDCTDCAKNWNLLTPTANRILVSAFDARGPPASRLI